jgi:hypothetical protein
MSTPSMDEVVVTCPPGRKNNDAHGWAIYIRAVVDPGGGTTHVCSSSSSKLMVRVSASATTSRTLRHHRCYSWADAGHARSRAPVTLAIPYSQASLCPGVPFFFCFSFFGGTQQLCISICSLRWCQNNTLLHGYDHIHLDLSYLGIKGLSFACGTRWFLLQSQHTWHHDAATVEGCQLIKFYLQLILQSHRLWCCRCDCGGKLEYIL